ncbi:PREDICTED: uncharacterized protein LOC106339020 [Brassica oleracea var. oleracea]|uniref:uncharacterized protein LOC106339020 n=1 Tax=Brassica oleracea var. oleracea TaxID=109376 RepID=UPI0006A6BFFC|nr:PREDICTED: uncharacterized protein LOC106339020 [Brassica oleracea var. oleracea]
MKETESIDDFVGKLSEISSKSASLGENIDESKIVKNFLSSLPRKKYIHIVASLEQVLDLNITTFEDIIGRLKAYEERVGEDEADNEDQNKLMYANSDNQSTQSNREYNGRGGRGGRFNGRGRGEEDIIDTQEANRLLMHEVVYLNEKNVKPKDFEDSSNNDRIWYLDNGASNHITGKHDYFKTIDESITEKVRFGDDSRIDIKGKGSILFVSQNGSKKVLADVYYIPDLKSNIISLGQATESGCEIKMKDGYLTLHDKDGKLIVQAKRSVNRLYKVLMDIVDVECNQVTA